MVQDSQNLHSQYPDFSRHWCDTSEQYAGGDALLTAMQNEWIAEKTCYEEHHWHAGTRLVTIYHFELHNGDETLHMPVITNPYVRRILREENFNVVEMNESRKSVAEQHRYEGHPHSNA
jgi:hypothetical protein